VNRFLFCIVIVLAGCASIVGIDDHLYQPVSSQCEEYCTTVMANCTGQYQVYSGMETCLGVCKLLPAGDELEPIDNNSVACRKRQAGLANTEPDYYCPRAGPGGGPTCGTNCQGYCTLLKAACPDTAAPLTNCEQSCSALLDVGTFDVVANHSGDTLQCRLVHVSSATVDPTTHCGHTDIHPTPPWCIEDQTAPPDCTEFCRMNLAACSGDNAVYESTAQCMAVCAALPPGTNGDQSQNTVGCRHYHCYNALIDIAHCSHTGPGGDGHCGTADDDTGNCFSYCTLLGKACKSDFTTKFGDPDTMAAQASCQKDCNTLAGAPNNSMYKVSAAQTGNTLQCRLLHVSRALTDATTECPNALGNAGTACVP
jgi:hypothetical protein